MIAAAATVGAGVEQSPQQGSEEGLPVGFGLPCQPQDSSFADWQDL